MGKTKKAIWGVILLLVVSFNIQAAEKKAEEKAPDQAADMIKKVLITSSHFHWLAKKLTGQHEGTVDLKNGEVQVQGNDLKGGQFAIDLATLKCTDLTDPETNAKLVKHLKSEDFFEVEKFPLAELKITSVKKVSGNKNITHEITGDLTMKGATHPITIPAIIEVKDGKATAKGTMTIDRTIWDLRYGSKKFFTGLGDKVINDQFTVDFELGASL